MRSELLLSQTTQIKRPLGTDTDKRKHFTRRMASRCCSPPNNPLQTPVGHKMKERALPQDMPRRRKANHFKRPLGTLTPGDLENGPANRNLEDPRNQAAAAI